MKRLLVLLSLVTLLTSARQHRVVADKPVARWTFTTSPAGIKEDLLQSGDQIDLIFTATLEKDWYVYSSDFKADIGPQPTTFEFMPDDSFEFIGSIEPVSPKRKKDKTWDIDVSYFDAKAEFRQRIRILKPDYGARGVIKGQYCSEKKGLCIPFEQVFGFSVQ